MFIQLQARTQTFEKGGGGRGVGGEVKVFYKGGGVRILRKF